jgi:tetratricopeptide (TPR) repeat protein
MDRSWFLSLFRPVPAVLVLLALTVGAASAQRVVSTTGTRLGSTTTGRTIIQFDEPAEIRRVLRLLDAGKVDEALAVAEAYIDSLENTVYLGQNSSLSSRYLAFNALCAALTRADEPDRALEVCTEAIELMPGYWSAVNNRGTVHFLEGDYEQALVDYRRALSLASENDATATVRHNIELAESRLRGGSELR